MTGVDGWQVGAGGGEWNSRLTLHGFFYPYFRSVCYVHHMYHFGYPNRSNFQSPCGAQNYRMCHVHWYSSYDIGSSVYSLSRLYSVNSCGDRFAPSSQATRTFRWWLTLPRWCLVCVYGSSTSLYSDFHYRSTLRPDYFAPRDWLANGTSFYAIYANQNHSSRRIDYE